eukprot:GHVU01058396.1.p1 GENE.GHVU01058396.1~~GHVU01058396.1.p1  ORF type:complete len:706 (-),score=100.88 GHVU01058396.1:430-2430(-)
MWNNASVMKATVGVTSGNATAQDLSCTEEIESVLPVWNHWTEIRFANGIPDDWWLNLSLRDAKSPPQPRWLASPVNVPINLRLGNIERIADFGRGDNGIRRVLYKIVYLPSQATQKELAYQTNRITNGLPPVDLAEISQHDRDPKRGVHVYTLTVMRGFNLLNACGEEDSYGVTIRYLDQFRQTHFAQRGANPIWNVDIHLPEPIGIEERKAPLIISLWGAQSTDPVIETWVGGVMDLMSICQRDFTVSDNKKRIEFKLRRDVWADTTDRPTNLMVISAFERSHNTMTVYGDPITEENSNATGLLIIQPMILKDVASPTDIPLAVTLIKAHWRGTTFDLPITDNNKGLIPQHYTFETGKTGEWCLPFNALKDWSDYVGFTIVTSDNKDAASGSMCPGGSLCDAEEREVKLKNELDDEEDATFTVNVTIVMHEQIRLAEAQRRGADPITWAWMGNRFPAPQLLQDLNNNEEDMDESSPASSTDQQVVISPASSEAETDRSADGQNLQDEQSANNAELPPVNESQKDSRTREEHTGEHADTPADPAGSESANTASPAEHPSADRAPATPQDNTPMKVDAFDTLNPEDIPEPTAAIQEESNDSLIRNDTPERVEEDNSTTRTLIEEGDTGRAIEGLRTTGPFEAFNGRTDKDDASSSKPHTKHDDDMTN